LFRCRNRAIFRALRLKRFRPKWKPAFTAKASNLKIRVLAQETFAGSGKQLFEGFATPWEGALAQRDLFNRKVRT
jgi:hypothetical protein